VKEGKGTYGCNAASVVGLLLTTEATIVEKPSKESAMPGRLVIL